MVHITIYLGKLLLIPKPELRILRALWRGFYFNETIFPWVTNRRVGCHKNPNLVTECGPLGPSPVAKRAAFQPWASQRFFRNAWRAQVVKPQRLEWSTYRNNTYIYIYVDQKYHLDLCKWNDITHQPGFVWNMGFHLFSCKVAKIWPNICINVNILLYETRNCLHFHVTASLKLPWRSLLESLMIKCQHRIEGWK